MSSSSDWNKAHRDKCRDANRRWRIAHPEQALEISRRYADHLNHWTEWCVNNPEKVRAHKKAWRENNAEKVEAQRRLNFAVEKGEIIRPTKCQKCGSEGGRIEAHHWSGYDEEHVFDVMWLCGNCHRLTHKKRASK
jgi:hypothetical protein